MALKILSPFPVVSRLAGETTLDAEAVSLRSLRDAVMGREIGLSRSRAMALLAETDWPGKVMELGLVLADETSPLGVRIQAATILGRQPGRESNELLVQQLGTGEGRLLAAVFRALGRVGDENALVAVRATLARAQASARAHGEFAAALMAHRLRSAEGDVSIGFDALDLPDAAARPFDIERAGGVDAEFAIRSLAWEPFGIDYSEPHVYQMRCGRSEWIILFNRNLTRDGATRSLARQRALLGLVASRFARDSPFFARLLILASPNPHDRVGISLHRTRGAAVIAGHGTLVDGRLDVELRSRAAPGAYPFRFEGRYEDGTLTVHRALAAPFRAYSRLATPDSRRLDAAHEGRRRS